MSLAAMGISDMLGHWFQIPSMGFYAPALMLSVYFAVGSSALVGKLVQSNQKAFGLPLYAGVPLGAIASTALFFLITNFASWLDPQMPYAKTGSGLLECYFAALPFTKNTLFLRLPPAFVAASFFSELPRCALGRSHLQRPSLTVVSDRLVLALILALTLLSNGPVASIERPIPAPADRICESAGSFQSGKYGCALYTKPTRFTGYVFA